MTETHINQQELKRPGYEIFIGALSVLSIVNLFLAYFITADEDLQNVLLAMNALLSAIFMIDFTYRLVTVPSKSEYFFRQYGWVDLLSSVPLPQLKILRIFRLVRVFRLMRDFGARKILDNLIDDRAGSALITLLLMGILLLEFGSLSILYVESQSPNANIKSASDAMWYTIVTISTVGYGDRYPTTNQGRLVGSLIILVGVAIFGTFTGYLANLFLAPRKTDSETG
jgi:Ion transport protein